MHHMISDDWSVQIVLRELAALYGGHSLPELPLQYADYARWQSRWLAGERLAKQIGYWRDHLRGAPSVTALPLDHPRRPGTEFHAAVVQLRLDGEVTARLRRVARESETTLFVTLLAAYALLLSRYGTATDIVIGTVLANRHPVEVEGLIGFFVNTLALRIEWREGASFHEIQACAHRAAVNGYAHPDVPFDWVVDALQPERSPLHNPVFQTLFVLQNVPRHEFALPGLTMAQLDLERPSAGATFDLSLSMRETGGELCAAFEFNTALFETTTIQNMASDLKALLADITGVAAAHN
jgi:hypothetical protein